MDCAGVYGNMLCLKGSVPRYDMLYTGTERARYRVHTEVWTESIGTLKFSGGFCGAVYIYCIKI